MDRWIQFKNQATMGYFLREDIPFQFALADAFTICDGYHCSILTGTDPNRIVFWSGSNYNPELRKKGINSTDADSEPVNSRCWPSPSNWVAGRAQQADGSGQVDPGTGAYNYKYENTAFKWDTLPDVLQQAGISWHIYQNMNNNWTGAMHGGLAFQSFRTAQPGSPLYEHGLTGGPASADGAVNFLAQLKQDVINDTPAAGLVGAAHAGPGRASRQQRRHCRRRRLHLGRAGGADVQSESLEQDGPFRDLRRERRLLRPSADAGGAVV